MPYLRLPNGSYVETPEGMSDRDAFAKAREKFPEAFEPVATPKKGIGAALGRGAESFISAGRTSLESILDPNKAAAEGLRREEALGKKYADQIGLDKLQEAYEKKGIFGAVGEVGRQIPLALAEQAPNIAASIASAKLGAMGGTAVLPGVGTVIGAGLGALTPSALQLFGSNVQRQAAEQEAAGRPVDIGVGKALGATAVQAPLDVAATFIPLGGRIAGKVFGPEVEKLLSRGGTKAAEKLAQESLTKTLAKGTAFGAAVEVPTEITQQMLERYQAGLSLTTPDALKEYGETAYQAGLLGPLGAVGRLSDRSAARNTIEAKALEEQNRLAAEQNRLAEETKAKEDAQLKVYYASPEGQAEIQKTQADFTQRLADLEAVKKQKDLSKEDKLSIGEQIKSLKQEQTDYAERISTVAPKIPGAYKTLEQRIEDIKLQREQKAAEAQAKEAERLQQAREIKLGEEIPASKFAELPGAKSTLTVAEKEAQVKELEDTRAMLANSIPRMENMLDNIQTQISDAIEKGDTETYRRLVEDQTQFENALQAAKKQQELLPKPPEEERVSLEKEIATLKKQAVKYTGPAFDQEKLEPIIKKLEKAQKRLEELPAKEQEDLFAPKQQGLAFEPTKEELAYDARRAELEKTFNTQMPQKVADDLVDSINNQPKSAENLELNALRINRINRAIEEAKAANDINTVNILNERLAEAKTSVESLGGSWSELTRKAEGRLDKALMDQQKAIDELRDAVEDLVKSRYLGKGQKETAFAATNKEGLIAKAEQAAGDYIEAAVRDVDARRAAAKQKAMTPDEALKLAYDLKDSLDNVIKNRNLSVLLRPEYIQQRLSLGQKTLREKMPDEERLVLNRIAAQYSKMQKEDTLQEGISQIEKQLAGIKQKYIKGESALKVEKQFFSAMERDPVQMLRTEKAKANPDLNKIRFLEKQIAETEEPVTGVSKVEKTGEYEVVGKKGEVKKVPTYKVTEQAALTPREKELAQFYPEYAKPDEGGVDLAQRELFGERDLEPVATVRATPANFMKFVGIQKQKLQLAKNLAQQAIEKAKVENDKYAKIVKELEQVKLELETVPLEKAPALYITVPEATKTFKAARIKLEDFTQKQEENAKALKAGVKAPHDLGRGPYQIAQKQFLTKAFLEAEKQLNKAQTDKERLPAARIKKFVEDSKAQRNRYIKRHLQLEVKKDKLLEKLGVTGEKRPLTEEQTAALLAQDNRKALIAKLSSDLETSYAQTKKELENRAIAMRELFAKPLEQALENDKRTEKEIKFYKDRIKWLKENTKGKSAKAKFVFEKEIPAYEKRLTELEQTLKEEQAFIEDIRQREESVTLSDIVRARENSDAFVKRTRKRLKKVLEESEAKGEVDQAFSQATLGKFDEAEAKAAADLEKRIAEKRVSGQKALEKGEAAAYVRQEVKPVVVKEEVEAKGAPEDLGVTTERTVEIGTKSRNLAAVRKLIRNKEAQLEKAKEGTPEYARLERQLGILKEARDRERQPLMQKAVTKKVGLGKTAEEKRQEVIERSREGAAEMAGIRKRLGKTIDEMPEYEADIKAYIKAIETRITANENALKTKALVGPLKQKFNSLAEKKETLTDVIKVLKDEVAKENVRIEELKEKTKAARALASLGDQPARKQRKKPLKTGVAEIEEGIKRGEKAFDFDMGVERDISGLSAQEFGSIFTNLSKGDVDFRIEETTAGTPLSQAEVQKLLDKVKMPKGLKVIVMDKLPDSIAKLLREQGFNPNKTKGWVDSSGTVVIVAGNHTSVNDAKETIAHELIGHVGVEGLLGEAGMKALIKKVSEQKGGVWKLAEDLGVVKDVEAAYLGALRVGKTKDEATEAAVKEMIAHVAETTPTKSFLQKANDFIKAMIGALRSVLRKMGLDLATNTSDVYKIIRDARKNFDSITPGAYVRKDGEITFRNNVKYNPNFADITDDVAKVVSRDKPLRDRVKGSAIGLIFRTRYIDRFAPIEAITKKMKDALEATQLMYYLRMHDQRLNWTAEIASNGPIDIVEKKRADGRIERTIESKKGANLKEIAEILRGANVGSPQAANELFTFYLAALRAKNKGIEKLNFSKDVTPELLAKVMKRIDANPTTKNAFEKAREVYNNYNDGLINFAVKTGAIAKADAALLLKERDYVPFYRPNDKGDVVLEIGGASPIKIGNLKDQPYLHDLVGGDTAIKDMFTSALQNTNLLTDMALRNLATRNVAFSLEKLALLKPISDKNKVTIRNGMGPADPKVIRFKIDGEDKHAIVEGFDNVPAELIVKGMEGVKTSLPNLVEYMAMPASTLRKFITRNPLYALRQVIRDSLSASMVSGSNAAPLLSSFKELNKMIRGKNEGEMILQRKGILGGQVLTGTSEDIKQIMLQITSGKPGWNTAMAKLDQLAIRGDAASRVSMYNSFLKQGLSEMEATLATLESMNFSKRGTSPSMFVLNMLVPFMNAQVQGLDVVYKAFAGKMPFDEKLKIKEKLIKRGAMMAGFTLAYAALMQDDEAYKNANPDEKYANWFMYVPGIDEPVRIPIPFELGLLFKALPEAIMNTAFGDEKLKDSAKAIGNMVWNSVPISLPAAIKPMIEVSLNKSFFTGREIESASMQDVEASERFTNRTSEIAKIIGKGTGVFGLSPIKLEYLIRGYTGAFPLAVVSLSNPVLRSDEAGDTPTTRASEVPVIGGLFQPKDASGLINKAYNDMEDVIKAKQTYNKKVEEGRLEEAEDYLNEKADLIGMATMAGRFRQRMGELTAQERQVRANPSLNAGEKRELLDDLRQQKIEIAKGFSSTRE